MVDLWVCWDDLMADEMAANSAVNWAAYWVGSLALRLVACLAGRMVDSEADGKADW